MCSRVGMNPSPSDAEIDLVDRLFPSTTWCVPTRAAHRGPERRIAPAPADWGKQLEPRFEALGVRLAAIRLAADDLPPDPSLVDAGRTLAGSVGDAWRVLDAVCALYADAREAGVASLWPPGGPLELYLDSLLDYGHEVALVLTNVTNDLRNLHVDWDDVRNALRDVGDRRALPSLRGVRLDLALLPVDGSHPVEAITDLMSHAKALFAAVDTLDTNLALRFG
jgi:hypothetical protein